MIESPTEAIVRDALRERATTAGSPPPLVDLYALAVDAPAADTEVGPFDLGLVSITAPRGRRPRRAVVIVAGAASVAAAVGLVMALGSGALAGGRHDDRAAAAASPGAAASSAAATSVVAKQPYAVTVGPLPSSLQVFTTYASGGRQTITLRSPESEYVADIHVDDVDDWHPAIPSDAVAVDVNGARGYYDAHFDESNDPRAPQLSGTTVPGVLWQFPQGLWGYVNQLGVLGNDVSMLQTPPLSQQQLVAVANAVRVDAGQVRKVPVRFGYLPTGLIVNDFTTINLPSGVVDTRFDLSRRDGTRGAAFEVQTGTLLAYGDTPGAHGPGAIVVNGFWCDYSPTDSYARFGNGVVSLEISPDSGTIGALYPQSELTRLMAGITVAPSMADTATWFNLADSVS